MSRRSLMRGAAYQRPDPRAAQQYLRCFKNEDLFWRPDTFPPLDSRNLFDNDLPLHLEIGCGTAEFLCALALDDPYANFVGVDVAAKPLFKAVRNAAAHRLPNIVFVKADIALLYPLLVDGSLQAIYLHFPDPHMKARFRKRRVLSEAFLNHAYRALASGGLLSVMTDHQAFFMEMLALLEQDGRFAKMHAERYLVGFEPAAKSYFQRLWESHGLPTLRVELQKTAMCTETCLLVQDAPDPVYSAATAPYTDDQVTSSPHT
jgi:tRNA (guanine-N7-)-methyltransferase